MIFGFGKKKELEAAEEEIEYVLFQGALNGKDANLDANKRLVEAGLVPAKELLTDALEHRAETIRIEPKGARAVATFYIDGVAYPGGRLSKQRALAVTQMIKLLAGMDVRQRKQAQSGGIKAEYQEKPFTLKIESTPVAGGAERLTVRVVNEKEKLETPSDLGFADEMRAKIREMTSQKKGVVLVCGPPHSGTSSTTMGVLTSIDAYMYSIYSIADLGGDEIMHVTSFEMKPEDDLATTFDRVIRVDADILFCDPIRDPLTAKTIFTKQAKIGVVAEFTAKDVAQGILQLIKWVGDPQTVAEALHGIFSQKLIRLLCSGCKQAYRPHPKLVTKVGLPPETKMLYRPPKIPEVPQKGEEEYEPCGKCGGIGYFGRAGMFEFIEMTEAMQAVVAAGPTGPKIKAQVKQEKMQTFQKEGLRFVAEGKTSLEELQRAFK